MADQPKSWTASPFGRLSTGIKMLLILSLGLLPLGMIAIFASVQSAEQNRSDRRDEIQAQVELSTHRLDEAIARSAFTIRAANAAIAAAGEDSPVCERTLARLTSSQIVQGSFALYGPASRLRCGTAGFAPPKPLRAGQPNAMQAILMADGAIRFLLFGDDGAIEAIGQFPASAVVDLTRIPARNDPFRLELVQGNRTQLLHGEHRGGALSSSIVRTSPIAGGQLQLRLVAAIVPISATELLLVLLPVVMWISAAFIGWLIVDRLLLRPLVQMQKAIAAYQPGEDRLRIPLLPSPAREIGELGQAFDTVAQTVARHEADLEAAVERQTKLVREVHHRVKNNLQVVASLLNLHSRGSRNDEVAAAYASIQRRVDALAVVHRNHYAELEENRGVGLKPLISELGFNLRATAPRSAAGMAINLNIEPFFVTQDVAVSIAFLITEIVEFAMFCGAQGVRISLTGGVPGLATLTVESESLRGDVPREPELFERFDRVVTGLSRQLRSAMNRDGEKGAYSLNVAVIDRGDG